MRASQESANAKDNSSWSCRITFQIHISYTESWLNKHYHHEITYMVNFKAPGTIILTLQHLFNLDEKCRNK